MEFKKWSVRTLYDFSIKLVNKRFAEMINCVNCLFAQNHTDTAKNLVIIFIDDCSEIKTIKDAKHAYNSALKYDKSPKLIIARWREICIYNLNDTNDIEEVIYIYINSPTKDVKSLAFQKWDNIAFEIIKLSGPDEICKNYFYTPVDGISRRIADRKIKDFNVSPIHQAHLN